MAKTRGQKEGLLDKYEAAIRDNKMMVVSEFKGLTMAEMTDLRNKLNLAGAKLAVIKNTVFTKAATKAGVESLNYQKLGKNLAIVYGPQDEVAVSKEIYNFAKINDKINIFGGIMDGKLVTVDMINKLAVLPSLDELRAKVVGSLNAPISGFVRVIAGPLRGFYNAVNALKEQRS